MAKCLVGANGGGKVTVTGLSAETLLTGNTVEVWQGAKEIAAVTGTSPRCLILASGWASSQQGLFYTPVDLKNASGNTVFKAGVTKIGPGNYTFLAPFKATRKASWAYFQTITQPDTTITEGQTVTFGFSNQSDRCVGITAYVESE